MKNKILTRLDKFIFNFIRILEALDIDYVIVGGYVSILFGRSRGTEDIDILVSFITNDKFKNLYEKIMEENYYFLNSDNPATLYEMLNEGLAVRIAEIDTVIPNIELKFVKNEFDKFSLRNRLRVVINGEVMYISPIEVQIAYKLYLGNDKDIEDAVYLWEIFRDYIDREKLSEFMKKMNVDGEAYGIG
ncbi:hypothetical protein DRP05_12520 [Archaeoglobales archaeon]|nr:MAG: hypothetical protein DRP05_12520 [Archaeoglobales archaeon]